MWELDHKERWVSKNSCFWTVVLEKTLRSLLDCKEIQLVIPKGNQFWIFIGRTDAEAETPIFWLPDAKNWLLGKNLHAGKDWKQEEKGPTEYEMVGWNHQLDGHEFEQVLGAGNGQGSLVVVQSQRDGHDWATELNWAFQRLDVWARVSMCNRSDVHCLQKISKCDKWNIHQQLMDDYVV